MKGDIYRHLAAHREDIDRALEAGASKAAVARTMRVKPPTFIAWLDSRDLGQPQADDGVQDALRRLAESVSA